MQLTLSIGRPILSHSGSSSLLPVVVVAKNERSASDMPSNDMFTLILANFDGLWAEFKVNNDLNLVTGSSNWI